MSADKFALYDAAYVLGALSPADRHEFEEHVRGCAECASSVGELAGLPGLMSKVSQEQLNEEAEPLPATLLPSLAHAVGRERWRRRIAAGGAAAAAVLLVAVGTSAVIRSDSPVPAPVASSASPVTGTGNLPLTAVVPSPVTASARLVDMAWGTRIDLTCSYRSDGRYLADGVPYTLVVINRAGAGQQVAAWTALPDHKLTVLGASSLARADITAVEIRTTSGKAILRLST
ncbi:MAG: zf-HC2 domain-containing protein [Dermatophilaceae bacterium]